MIFTGTMTPFKTLRVIWIKEYFWGKSYVTI